MDNKKVPGTKISSRLVFLILGSSVAMGANGETKQDSWIAVVAATGAALLLAWLYSAVLRLHPGKNMFDIFVDVFGNIGGKIVCALYVIYTVYLGARIFSLYDNFIRIVNLDSTPIAAILLISVPLIAGLVKCGLKNMGSCAKFLIVIVFLMTAITVVLGARFMDLGNIKPILVASPKAMLSTVFAYLTLPLGEIVVGMSFFGEIDQKESPFRILSKGVLIGGAFLTVISLRNLLLLGSTTCRLFLFTSYDAVGVISIGDFVTRISVFIGVEMTLTGVIKLSVFTYSTTLGVSKILGLKKFLQPAAPCCVLMAALSMTLYSNFLTEMNFQKYVSLIDIPFQLIFPVVTLIVGRIRQGGRKKDAAKKAAPVKEAAPAPKEPAL